MSELRVFTFAPDWGLPSGGPFSIKLLAWLKLAGIPYEQVIEANPRKGPKGKNPWIELDGERIGDSEVIIDLLSRRYNVRLEDGLTAEQIALGHAWRRTFEEHFHQVLEWELFMHPAGAAWMRASIASQMPPVLGPAVFLMLRSHFSRQLHARGIARHPPESSPPKDARIWMLSLLSSMGGPFWWPSGRRPPIRPYSACWRR
jgi:glutathione S-transferase